MVQRRQRWAAFSVKAHLDIKALAVDLLLYDRLILPTPADEKEHGRWESREWNPNELALRIVQSGGAILPVPWTDRLRAEWREEMSERRAQLKQLHKEFGAEGFALTGMIYASSPEAWQEIDTSLREADDRPPRKPWLVAGFQSEEEANAALNLRPAPASVPGARPADEQVKLMISRTMYEPDIEDPELAWDTATNLILNERFLRAREALFDLEDRFAVDEWEPDDIDKALSGVIEEYHDAVAAVHAQTRRRIATTILPKVGATTATALGHPHAASLISRGIQLVMTALWPVGEPIYPEGMPGAAPDMIGVAFRKAQPEPEPAA